MRIRRMLLGAVHFAIRRQLDREAHGALKLADAQVARGMCALTGQDETRADCVVLLRR